MCRLYVKMFISRAISLPVAHPDLFSCATTRLIFTVLNELSSKLQDRLYVSGLQMIKMPEKNWKKKCRDLKFSVFWWRHSHQPALYFKFKHSHIAGEHRRRHTCETSAWHQYHCAHISMLTLALSCSAALHSHRHGCEIFLIGPVLSSHLFRPH